MKTNIYDLMPVDLTMFDGDLNTNVTTDSGLSGEMKTFYSDYLIDIAGPLLVHQQFGQKQPIPRNGGKVVEFRSYNPLPKMTTPLVEGVTPNGQKLDMETKSVEVKQYGGYVTLSDMLLLTAIDNNLVHATEQLGDQAGRTLDTIVREVLVGGTNVRFANEKASRHRLNETDVLTVAEIRKAVRDLTKMNAHRDNGYYIGIINQDCSYDLMNDPDWKYPHQYVDTKNIYTGEIGAIAGVRFVETSEAKIFHAPDLTAPDGENTGYRDLSVKAASGKTIVINEEITEKQANALPGRKVLISGYYYTLISAVPADAGGAAITVDRQLEGTVTADTVIYPGEAGAKGRDAYATLIFGKNAYGTTEISGGGLQHIVKQLGSAGTADPLNQRATVSWKATLAALILVEAYMVRLETVSSFNDSEGN